MLCGVCGHWWEVSDEWVDEYQQGREVCPSCGTDCTAEDGPIFWHRRDDPAQDDSFVRGVWWYHSSTHARWPADLVDPDYAGRALHVGTYEAAIENMLRRMSEENDASSPFRLYRVRLAANAVVEQGVHEEFGDWLGVFKFADIRSAAAVTAVRYVNVEEDPSNISLALDPLAIEAVQELPIPLATAADDVAWVRASADSLTRASLMAAPEATTRFERLRRRQPSALHGAALRLIEEVRSELPERLHQWFAPGFDEEVLRDDPSSLPAAARGLLRLVTDPSRVLSVLDSQPWRAVDLGR